MARRTCQLIYNPVASTTHPRAAHMVAERLETFGQVELLPTEFSGHAQILARQIVRRGDDRPLIVLGGDGTANQVASALIGSPVSMLALPGGSTSAFARSLGAPADLRSACDWGLDKLLSGGTRQVDVGQIGDQIFLFAAGMGLDAETARAVDQRPAHKARFRGGFFAWTAMSLLGRGYLGKERLEVQWPGGVQKGSSLILQNGPLYSYLGSRPLILDPQGSYQSGGISGLVIHDLDLISATRLASQVLAGIDPVSGSEHLTLIPPSKQISVKSIQGAEYQVDGEAMGQAYDLQITCLPGALQVCC